MRKAILLFTLPLFLTCGCTKDIKLNVFTIAQDKQLGSQLDQEIRTNKTEYPLLDSATNPDVYKYLYAMRDDILSSNLIFHKDDFNWRVTIINKPILNAFAAPGGKIYVYTGLLKYVKSGSELAGILAHEVCHADRRHSTEQMTKIYGFQVLLNIALGADQSGLKDMAKQMATGAAGLAWSRSNEYDADSMSVEFLYSIKGRKNYQINALTDFFVRMEASRTAGYTPEWLQTHPKDDNRIARVAGHYKALGSPIGDYFVSDYDAIVAKLPK